MILFYAALIVAIVAALLAIRPYIQQRIQGVYQQAADSIGDEEQR